MNMTAIIIRVDQRSLLVRNEETSEEVLVIYRSANNFSVGERVRITYNGRMTFSIPPQITATSIERLRPVPQPEPSEIRVEVIQRGRNFLMVVNTQNRQRIRVEYTYAHHFCIGQQVVVRYNTITMSNPPRVTAADIIPVC